ncbi:hypothetical protein KAR91_71665 [Candidatus Pacearchaeota archaeon]|nr:hypothetical protein [Candidatus Pacearchaeota archaeon]
MTFNDAREAISNTVYTLHMASYASVPIVLPNKKGVDIENEEGPFVQLKINFGPSRQLQMGAKCTKTQGHIVISHHVREQYGLKSSMEYTDFLVSSIGLQTIDDVIYREVAPTGQDLAIGWYTVFNFIPFRIFNII